ncbi:MAG: TonB family protein [Vicinamibacteria bacterium]
MSNENASPAYFGRYQVLEELGSGAMGVVYLCVDPRLTRPVAIKVLKESEFTTPAEREEYRARFRHEAEAAGRLNHPGIVQIYDIGPSYLVMEYLEGQSLLAVLKNGVGLTVGRIAEIVHQAGEALDYAHRHGIVHRDVKPANVMIAEDGVVKVMDFGVARLDTSKLTAVGTVVGSVRYMAPEQMMGERVDGRADVFSLAAVAYELLTGRPPFPGKTITEVVSRVVHGSHVPPRQVDGRLPEELDGVFARAFAPRPENRYSRAGEMTSDLRAATRPIHEIEIVHASGEGSSPPPAQATTVRGDVPTEPPAGSRLGETVVVPPPPATYSQGAVLFESDPPGALVHLDSKPVGRAPLPAVDVPFGRHLVRMEAEGRETVSLAVEVRPERPLKVVSVTLPPKSASTGLQPGQLVNFGPDVTPPRRLSGRSPAYPSEALAPGLEGCPVVELWVSELGDVINCAVVESAGAVLDNALLSAVSRWRFVPAQLRGVPVTMRITVQHLFRR